MNVERDRTGRNSSFGSAAANTPNPTQSLTQAMKKQLALLAALLAAASVNAASVIDSFNDVKGATNAITLAQINSTGIGGVGFTSKYEQTGSAVAVLKTNDQAVSLGNYVSGQAANTQHWSVAATPLSSGLARRVQTRSTPAMYSYSPIWFSFLATLQSPAGDVALTFNGTLPTSGQFGAGSAGLRVGLGHFSNANFRGAMGVGPVATATGQAELTNIVNGVNGAVTAAGFAPTNGTPGLVLGRIDNDPNNGSPRVSLWYNPNVPDAASLPAPTLTFTDTTGNIVPSTVTRIGYQVVRSGTLGVQNEMIDNVKVSDDATAFDIVYKNAALPTPVLNVAATVAQGSEQGPTNIVFTITSDRAVTADLAIPYTLSGAATNGYIPYSAPATYTNADFIDAKFNPDTQSSTVTIPAGQSNATIVLQVLNDTLPEATEPITLTVQPQPSSYILSSGAATASIQDDNDANTSVQYMFERNGLPETWDTNLVALPAAVASGFNFNSTA